MGTAFSRKVYSQLGLCHTPGVNNVIPEEFVMDEWIKSGHRTKQPAILFSTLTPKRVAELRRKYSGGAANANGTGKKEKTEEKERGFALDLRVAKIVECEEHAESERLFVAKVDVGEGEGPRTLVAGLRDVYTKEELLGKQVVAVCNLVPATLAGIESQAMILCADKKKVMEVLGVPDGVEEGERLCPDGMEFTKDSPPLDRKAFQAASKLLRVGKQGAIVFNKQKNLVARENKELVVTVNKVAEGGKVK